MAEKNYVRRRLRRLAKNWAAIISRRTGLSKCIKYIYKIDIEFYRGANVDLAALTDEELVSHYVIHGKKEGRLARFSDVTGAREHFLTQIPQLVDVLEIGPFNNPVIRGDRVKYFDVLDKKALISRGNDIGFNTEILPTFTMFRQQAICLSSTGRLMLSLAATVSSTSRILLGTYSRFKKY